MMSQTISPTLMANIARMVAQQLQQGGVVNPFSKRPAFLRPENNAIIPYNNSSLVPNSNSPCQISQIDDGHSKIYNEDAPRITRTNSSTSTSSASTVNFNDDEVMIVAPPPPLPKALNDMGLDYLDSFSGKNKKSKYLPQDKAIVNDPILELLDALYLAPFKSELFKRKRVKMPDANGFRRMKKNPDIVMPLFKTLTKGTLRRLLALAGDQDSNLRQRYFYAALAVTTKRRANHIQCWRLNGGPLSFCYGGEEIYRAKYGDVKYKNKSVVKSEKKESPTPAMKSAFSLVADFSDDEGENEQLVGSIFLQCCICKGKVSFNPTDQQKPPNSKSFTCDICLEGGKAKCAGCGKFFEIKLMFPQCDKEFKKMKNNETLRCNFCWQTLIKNKILPNVNARRETVQKQTGKNTSKTSRKCKCGSTTHKTANSRLCPLNKRYNQQGRNIYK